MIKALRNALAVLCIVTIALCAILIVQKAVGRARVDLTQDKLYTLSPGTHNILAKLNQPVKLTLYYSRTAALKGPEGIRYYNAYYLYVRDILDEYVRLAGGKLKLEVIDPKRYSDEEETAIAQGIKRFPLSEEENFFFGLVAQTELGKSKAIPFFEPNRQEFVEYDLSKVIASVSQRDKKKVGVISSLDLAGADLSPYMMQMMQMQGRNVPKPWTIITQLRDSYEVQSLPKDEPTIPAGIDFLMVVHPKDLSQKTLFAIDQYVMKGGRLAVFVDPHCMSDRGGEDPRNPYASMGQSKASDLNPLLRKWGVEMEQDVIAVDPSLAKSAPLGRNQRMEQFLPYMELSAKDHSFNTKEVITGKLNSVRVLFAGVLNRLEDAKTTVTPLLSTTETGSTWKPSSPFELQMPNPEAVRRGMSRNNQVLMLGCKITGKLQTNFPDGLEYDDTPAPSSRPGGMPPDMMNDGGQPAAANPEEKKADDSKADEKKADEKKPDEPKKKKLEAVKETSDAVVLVFADVDMISDMMAYQETFFGTAQVGDNASLVFNALDYLAGSSDLIGIRSRSGFSRPFTAVEKIEREAEKATGDEVKAINEKIEKYQAELSKLGSGLTKENEKLIGAKALGERAKIEEEIRLAKKELRRLNANKLSKIDRLKARLVAGNMFAAPAVVLLIAIVLAVVRYIRARRYVARRAQS